MSGYPSGTWRGFLVEVIEGQDLRAMSGSYRGSGSASYHPKALSRCLNLGAVICRRASSSAGAVKAGHIIRRASVRCMKPDFNCRPGTTYPLSFFTGSIFLLSAPFGLPIPFQVSVTSIFAQAIALWILNRYQALISWRWKIT
jgi:hypothetical protein